MKKFILLFVSVIFISSISINSNKIVYAEEEKSYINNYLSETPIITSSDNSNVKTPNGTDVAYIINQEFDIITIGICNSLGDNKVPNATRIANSSNKYNCHSYAWYKQSTDNKYWIPNPSPYYEDHSYEETFSPCIGDKICYFNEIGENVHSGIIFDIVDNEIKVRSKWGPWGLYEHSLLDCPYTSQYGGNADIIKYYHRHEYTYKSINSVNHTKSCVCGENKTEGHIWIPYSGTILSIGEELEENANPLAITKTRVECKYCHYIKILNDDEIIPILP